MEAKYYTKLEGGRVRCLLCPQSCLIEPGGAGRCRVRTNRNGRLEADSYARLVSLSMDPMEKKPLYHFHPGSYILSVGPNGCNLSCQFCQNWEISQAAVPTARVSPEELILAAKSHQSVGLAYTYTEPLIWFEYLMDVLPRAREQGLVNVLVTNGFINPEPLRELLPYIDAMNVDLKSMDPEFYRRICGGELAPVLRTIEQAHGRCWVEITNLVIPGLNDSPQQQQALVDWVADLDPKMPLHLSRYFPQYKMTRPATPESTLISFANRAREKLSYVYVGNIRLPDMSDTFCPGCGQLLIDRDGYRIRLVGLKGDVCARCGRRADMVGLR